MTSSIYIFCLVCFLLPSCALCTSAIAEADVPYFNQLFRLFTGLDNKSDTTISLEKSGDVRLFVVAFPTNEVTGVFVSNAYYIVLRYESPTDLESTKDNAISLLATILGLHYCDFKLVECVEDNEFNTYGKFFTFNIRKDTIGVYETAAKLFNAMKRVDIDKLKVRMDEQFVIPKH